jgi:hypothetical protein
MILDAVRFQSRRTAPKSSIIGFELGGHVYGSFYTGPRPRVPRLCTLHTALAAGRLGKRGAHVRQAARRPLLLWIAGSLLTATSESAPITLPRGWFKRTCRCRLYFALRPGTGSRLSTHLHPTLQSDTLFVDGCQHRELSPCGLNFVCWLPTSAAPDLAVGFLVCRRCHHREHPALRPGAP